MGIDEMVEQLLDMDIVEGDAVVFSDEAKRLIHKIAEKCNGAQIVRETQQETDTYADGMSAEEVYVDMLLKIVNAPTRIHMLMSARMLIPVIDRKLKGVQGG